VVQRVPIMSNDTQSVTDLLAAYRCGHKDSFDRLVELIYPQLRELAHIQLRQRHPSETLNTTGLVNEAYCKLAEGGVHHWKDRNHFYAACATTMRHLLVDNARRRLRDKRGRGMRALTLEENELSAEGDPEWLIELDRLMDQLAEHDRRLVAVFECRYFGGFTNRETAEILSLSERTIERDWARSRAWLKQALSGASKDRNAETSGKEL
jgi:RNA polymerase sigma factor (TIGR02999 family)